MTATSARGIENCRLCGQKLRETILSLGNQPLSNRLPSIGDSNQDLAFPLDFKICPHCSLGQIGEFVSPEKIFSDYTYFSSTSKSWLKHASDFANNVRSELKLDPNDLVVEIASNDGYLLQFFKNFGCEVLGIEPAETVALRAIEVGIPTQIEFFGKECAEQLIQKGIVPKLVVCNNVLAHVPDINDFMAGLAILVNAGATVSIEAPSLKIMLENNLFDTIYHEHFSYLSVTSVLELASRHGIKLQRVEMLSTHGGSYRYWIRTLEIESDSSVSHFLKAESEFGIANGAVHESFAENSRKAIAEFQNWCKFQLELPIGFGAAAKATVLLNAAGITSQDFECIGDNAGAKQNRMVPGVRVPILSPVEVLSFSSRNLVIFPWNISNEIALEISSSFPEFLGEIWTPLPEMRRLR
jgi:hypothetical protein